MALEKAMLIRLGDDEEVPDAETINGYRADEDGGDDENWLRVHFNPETLKTSISTNLKSSDRGSGRTTGQYIEKRGPLKISFGSDANAAGMPNGTFVGANQAKIDA